MMEHTYHINGKTPLLFIDIMEDVLGRRANWRRLEGKEGADWSDLEVGRIRNKFSAKWALITKDYLAKKMKRSGHIPTTYVLQKGRFNRADKLPGKGDRAKWFLKPVGGWGGKGIAVFKGFSNVGRNLKRGGDYVLQREVGNPMLFEGKKFDIRTFVAVIYHRGKYHLYLYPNGICRVSMTKYSADRTNSSADITNTHVQENQPGYTSAKINKLLSDFDWFPEVLPKMEHIPRCTLKRMGDVLGRPSGLTAVEIISFDYIVDTSKRVYLIELNRNIGYGFQRKPEYVRQLYLEMFEDLVDFAYEPLLERGEIGEPARWRDVGTA